MATPTAATAAAVTAPQETIALPTLKKASVVPSAHTNSATTAPESWGSTAVEKPAKSRAPLMIGLLGGVGLGVAVVAGILHWKASENAAAPESSAVPLSADSALTASPVPAVSAPPALAESTAAALVSAAPAAGDKTVDAGTDPDDPAALKAAMLAHTTDKAGYAAALDAAKRLFELAPETARDEDMRRTLLRIANGRTPVAAQALDAMTSTMGSFGPDMLFEVANDPSMEKLVRDRAQKLVTSAGVKKLATPALLVVMALKPLAPCARKALFARAKEEADARALPYLRPLLVTGGCSKLVVMKTDCYPCLKDRTDLFAAIKAIEERGSKR